MRYLLLILAFIFIGTKSISGQEISKTKLSHTLEGHSDRVIAVAFGPEDRYLASGSVDNTVKIWGPSSGKRLRTMEGHSESVRSVAFSPKGHYLASGSDDNTIKLWDPSSGELLRTLEGHSESVRSVAFGPKGRYLVSGSDDNTIKLWDPASGELLRTLESHSSNVYSVAFGPNGRYLASGSDDNTIKLWDPASGELLRTLESHSSNVYSVAFSPKGRYLASGSADNNVKIWNSANGELLHTLEGHSALVNSVAFEPNGRYLASGSWDNTVKLWDPSSGELLLTPKGQSSNVNSVAFGSTGSYLASGSAYNFIKLWKIPLSQYLKISKYVKNQPDNWRQEGAYGKLAAYRRNPDSMNKVLTQKAIQKFGEQTFNQHQSNGSFNYDTRNQVFKLSFPSFFPIYLKVPLQESKPFHRNFDKLQYKNLKFGFDSATSQFFFKKVDVHNPANGQTYTYHHQDEVTFKERTPTKPEAEGLIVHIAGKESKDGGDENVPETTNQPLDLDQGMNLSKGLPDVSADHQNDFAVVIGNSQYQATKNVQFADQDAQLMKRYLVELLGFKEGNIFHLQNATKSDFQKYFGTKANHKGKLYNTIKHSQSDVFIYYSGHGAPSQETKQGYFVPTDADPAYLTFQGYSLSTFYDNLSKLPAQTKTVVLDACFSGADLFESVSSVRIEVKEKYKQKKDMAVLTSSTGTQYSTWYDAKQHGLFTWFFLKAIKNYRQVDTNNDRQVTLKEIHQYISDNNEGVPYYARRLHGKKQVPKLMGGEQEAVLFAY